jgi:hypothetical protein
VCTKFPASGPVTGDDASVRTAPAGLTEEAVAAYLQGIRFEEGEEELAFEAFVDMCKHFLPEII